MIWKNVRGYEGLYQVSKCGKVRSPRRILSPSIGKKGYAVVGLSKKSVVKYYYIHQLVLAMFEGPVPMGKECCHNDGNPRNNNFSNLRYDTPSGNALDRHKHGTLPDFDGEKAYWAKLNDKKVTWIRRNKTKFSSRKMGKKFGVCHKTILDVINNRSWRKLNGPKQKS